LRFSAAENSAASTAPLASISDHRFGGAAAAVVLDPSGDGIGLDLDEDLPVGEGLLPDVQAAVPDEVEHGDEHGEVLLQGLAVQVLQGDGAGSEAGDPLPYRLDVPLVVLLVGLVLEPELGLPRPELGAYALPLAGDLHLLAGLLEGVDELVHGDGADRLPPVRLPELHLWDHQLVVVVEERVVEVRGQLVHRGGLGPVAGALALQPEDLPRHQHELAGHDHVEAVGGDLPLVHPDELRQVDLPGVDAVLQHQAEDGAYRLVHGVLQALPRPSLGQDVHVSPDFLVGLRVVREGPVEQQVLLQFVYPCIPIHFGSPRPSMTVWQPAPHRRRPRQGPAA
jgi:hypothetical protein